MLKNVKKTENLHIAIWLVKDTCWCLNFHPLAMLMILPTIAVALYIVWHTRKSLQDLFHNIAVTCWICANSIWMTGEFFFEDGTRPLALAFFGLGLAAVTVYYVFFAKGVNEPDPTSIT